MTSSGSIVRSVGRSMMEPGPFKEPPSYVTRQASRPSLPDQ